MNRKKFKYQITALEHEKATIKRSDWMADYIKDIPFQVVLTLSGVGRYSMDSMKQIEKQLVESYEKYHRCPLSYVVSYETSPEKYANIHMAIACPYPIDTFFMDSYLSGRKVNFQIADVDPERKERLLPYMFKEMNYRPDYEFDLINCDYYLGTAATKKERKRQARHQRRLKKSA